MQDAFNLKQNVLVKYYFVLLKLNTLLCVFIGFINMQFTFYSYELSTYIIFLENSITICINLLQ